MAEIELLVGVVLVTFTLTTSVGQTSHSPSSTLTDMICPKEAKDIMTIKSENIFFIERDLSIKNKINN